MKAVLTLCLCVILSACTLPISTPFDGQTQKQIIPQSPALQAELDALAIPFLDSIQANSISQRREVCGYFFRHPEGDIRVTPPAAGTFATCELPRLGNDAGIVANYHTHGAFGVSYDNEVPSVNDFEAAQQLGMNGYLSTPGGRGLADRCRIGHRHATVRVGLCHFGSQFRAPQRKRRVATLQPDANCTAQRSVSRQNDSHRAVAILPRVHTRQRKQ